jgi:adenine-specific DNA methylase
VLLNKVVLEYIPKYGQRLADEVRKWGEWIKCEAEKELAEFYPKDADGATPIAYLWARTIQCEGPGCGAEVPLVRTLWLAKKANRSVAMQLVPNKKAKRVDFQIIVKERDGWVDQANPKTRIDSPTFDGAVKRGSATCPCCGYTTPVARVREQLKARHGGANDARLMCVVSTRVNEQGRFYRLPTETDVKAIRAATAELEQRKKDHSGPLSLVPNEKLDMRGIRHTWAMIYGLSTWEDFFTRRQALALTNIARLLNKAGEKVKAKDGGEFAAALQTCLAMVLGRQADALSASVTWTPGGEFQGHTFARQALAFVWDFAEVNPWCDSSGNFMGAVEWVAKVCATDFDQHRTGGTQQASATHHPLPDDSAHGFITDPPYYDAVPYSYLSDFFYVWLRRAVGSIHTELLSGPSVPKDEEVVVDRPHELSDSTHNIAFYERELAKAFVEGQRVLRPDGIGTIVFASKTTASWEAILKAVVEAGWIITGSWPIDTEREARVSAQGQARLASSVHLVCRPRDNAGSSAGAGAIGDWRDVLQELPRRIHEWMPRLAEEGVVGADAIFACLGPALEIFSRYQRVEKASGEQVTLTDYLESVWAAVAKEALATVLGTTDAQGFEPDARLTVIWLWVVLAGKGENATSDEEVTDPSEDEIIIDAPKPTNSGIVMEYDAARKLAQGMGVHLEELSGPGGILTVSGKQATLNRVSLRESFLFSSQQSLFDGDEHISLKQPRIPSDPKATLRSVSGRESDLFDQPSSMKLEDPNQLPLPTLNPKLERKSLLERLAESGSTTLDRLHQAMLLFSRGQVSLLSRFLEITGVGQDQKFWRLAQALSALYPSQTEEKRWVDGVLARKKGLGF